MLGWARICSWQGAPSPTGLRRVSEPFVPDYGGHWIVLADDLRRRPHVRRVTDRIVEFLQARRRLLLPEDEHRCLRYFIGDVRDAIAAGKTLEQTLASQPLDEAYLPPANSPLGQVRPIMQGFHLWNVKKTYLELSAEAAATQQAKVQ